jgi:hypothetical protein
MIQTIPLDGAQVRGTVNTLTVQFPLPVRGFWDNLTVQLEQIGSDGTATPVFDPNAPPNPSFDQDTGSVVSFALNPPLATGHYRLVLSADSTVGVILGAESDQTLADFTVLPNGPSFDNTTDLGTIGAPVRTDPVTLDLSGGQSRVDMYKLTLGPGHTWRLGVQLDASRIGSDLQGGLTLFDSSGNVVGTSHDSGTGRPDFPIDPYLFQGLPPGVYYLGVSGAGNLPEKPRGYDPKSGDPGSAGLSQRGGVYQLELAADPADQPTKVTGFRLDWADTLNPAPTGVTLAFSGPIDVGPIVGGAASSTLVAVDQRGKTWSLTSSGYDEAKCQLSFVFDQQLPAGRYTLALASPGSLTDLAGLPVTGPGPASKGLASWTVSARTKPQAADDLGVVWPSLSDGVSQSVTLLPGQLRVFRTVVSLTGWYKVQTGGTLQQVNATRLGPDGLVQLTDAAGRLQADVYLKPGVYLFALVNQQSAPLSFTWRLRAVDVDTGRESSLVASGVGQSAALSLRLLNPLPSDLTSGSGPELATVQPGKQVAGPATPSSESKTSGEPTASHATSVAVTTTVSSPVPSSLLVAVNTSPLGRPSSDAALSPLAARQGGAQSVDPTLRAFGTVLTGVENELTAVPDPGPTGHEPVPLVADAGDGAAGQSPAAVNPAGEDALALLRVDRIVDLAGRLERWLMGARAESDESSPATGDDLLASLLGEERAPGAAGNDLADSRQDRIERAELGVPITVVLAAAAAYRLRQFAIGWWRRSRLSGGALVPSRSSGRGWAGPHLGRTRPRQRVGNPRGRVAP